MLSRGRSKGQGGCCRGPSRFTFGAREPRRLAFEVRPGVVGVENPVSHLGGRCGRQEHRLAFGARARVVSVENPVSRLKRRRGASEVKNPVLLRGQGL